MVAYSPFKPGSLGVGLFAWLGGLLACLGFPHSGVAAVEGQELLVGALFGDKYRAPSERIGGIVLILIGLKTLLTGLGVL